MGEALGFRHAHNWCDQAAGDGHGNAHIGVVVFNHGIVRPRHIGFRHLDQRHGQGLDDEIIDGNFPRGLAVLVLRCLQIEAFAQGQEVLEGNIDGDIEMRHRLLGFRQPPRNGFAHAVMGNEIVGVRFEELENGIVRHALRHGCGLGGGGSARLGVLDILQDNAAMGPGAFQCREVDAFLLGDALGEWRCEYPASIA